MTIVTCAHCLIQLPTSSSKKVFIVPKKLNNLLDAEADRIEIRDNQMHIEPSYLMGNTIIDLAIIKLNENQAARVGAVGHLKLIPMDYKLDTCKTAKLYGYGADRQLKIKYPMEYINFTDCRTKYYAKDVQVNNGDVDAGDEWLMCVKYAESKEGVQVAEAGDSGSTSVY